jgi:hypothetical protein
VNGEQYLALLAGGSSFQLSKRGDSLWAFKLGGKVPQEPAPPEPPLCPTASCSEIALPWSDDETMITAPLVLAAFSFAALAGSPQNAGPTQAPRPTPHAGVTARDPALGERRARCPRSGGHR